jgi:hypothetical protein
MIMVAQFDILKRTPDGAYIWLEAVHDLSGAKGRLQELCVGSSDDYFLFDQKTRRVHTRRDLDHLSPTDCGGSTRWPTITGPGRSIVELHRSHSLLSSAVARMCRDGASSSYGLVLFGSVPN